jgi:hypothetical protein
LELRLAEADSQIKDLQAARDAQIQKDEGLRDEFTQLKAEKVRQHLIAVQSSLI